MAVSPMRLRVDMTITRDSQHPRVFHIAVPVSDTVLDSAERAWKCPRQMVRWRMFSGSPFWIGTFAQRGWMTWLGEQPTDVHYSVEFSDQAEADAYWLVVGGADTTLHFS